MIYNIVVDNARIVYEVDLGLWSYEIWKSHKFVFMGYVRSFTEHDYYYNVQIRLTKPELYKAIEALKG